MKNGFKLRNLSIAALVGLVGLGATNSAQANETPITPTLGDDASYTLKEVSTPTDNSITLYKYENTGITETINYEVNLKQTEYGSGDNAKYYKWTTDANGNYTFGETTQDQAQITAKYDASLSRMSSGNGGTDVNGDFIGNGGVTYGGAIYNQGTNSVIGNVTGNFVGNYATSQSSSETRGGAISNYSGTIGNIVGDFIGNYALSTSYGVRGGAITNYYGTITSITGDFIGNYSQGSGSSSSYGGAIYNYTPSSTLVTIGNITGSFIGNYVSDEYAYGGAIYNYANSAIIGNITGDFIGNYCYSSSRIGQGGAIYNSSKIGNITGDFIGNYLRSSSSYSSQGGAIYNADTIDSFTGNFIENYVAQGFGGVIYNVSKIGDITGGFINNYATQGGAIYNYSHGAITSVGDITGKFINNRASSISAGAEINGGAIYNYVASSMIEIGTVTADFIGNNASSTLYSAHGGAIYSYRATINAIEGNFVSNYVYSADYGTSGGAIYNLGTIGGITGDFIGNYAQGSLSSTSTSSLRDVVGGAIRNGGSIGDITGDFTGNYVLGSAATARGGTIYNYGTIGLNDLEGNVVGGIINSNFKNNYAKAVTGTARGGAIYTSSNLNIIADNGTSEFTGNYTESNGVKDDNAVYVDSNSATLTLNAKNNGIITFNDNIKGATGYTLALTGDNTGIINIHNTVSSANMKVSDIGKVDFVDNTTREYKLQSLTSESDVKYALDVDLTNKKADKFITSNESSGTVTIDELNILSGDWETLVSEGESKIQVLDTPSNTLQLALGDNLDLPNERVLKTIEEVTSEDITKDVQWNDTFDTIKTSKEYYGSIGLGTTDTTNDSIAVNITEVQTNSVTTPNGDTLQLWNQFDTTEEKNFNFDSAEDVYTATADSGATKGTTLNINGVLAEDSTRSTIDFDNHSGLEMNDVTELNIKNVSLENSSALITNNNADSTINLTNTNIKNNTGGITTKGDVNLTADGADVELSGNVGNAIYLDNLDKTLTINLQNGGTVTQLDNIDGQITYKVNIQGDDLNTSAYNLQGQILNADLGLGNITLNTVDGVVKTYEPYSLTLNQDVNMTLDVDLANETMDRFDAGTYGQHTGNLTVTGMNLLSDSKDYTTTIKFAEYGLKDNVKNNVAEIGNGVDNAYQGTAYSPIYKYTVSYDNKDDAGYFTFSRPAPGSSGSGSADSFNPAVLGSSTSATVGATATMNQAFNYAFQHSSDYMHIPYLERISMRDKNKYAISVTGDATDMGRFSPLYQPSQEEASVWVKPYATFETVGLKNGPKVHNNTYGTLIGFDTQMQSLRRGWDRVFTGYIGYNGASQRYSGIDSTQNGGLLGGTMTLYKGNFFNATTVSVGASVANNQTMYGNEDFAMLLSGIGNKTGYNFEFKEGKLILQPSMLMSYTFVNTFDYTNAAGVRIDNKPLHALQLAPGVKVIGNLKNGWQPYASVQMVWNLMGESNATANGVKLPEMSIKPYVQYGVGVQKRIKDHFTAYGQAMVQNGGRNGVSLTAGFRWALGHDNCKYEKTQRHPEVKTEGSLTSKEILRSAQNDRGKYIDNKTSSLDVGGVMPRAAEHKKILKQMTPEQKMAHGGKYMNTSRTAKTGSLRQY